MPLARSAGEPQLFAVSDGAEDGEFGQVLRTADSGPALDGALTFLPEGDWSTAWRRWWEQTLVPQLASRLLQTAALAERGCAREILALDRELDAIIATDAGARSRAAGRRLLARLSSSRGERCLGKFAQWVAAEEAPAHFPTVHAIQHALFHLPPRLLPPTYAYWEWSAAGGETSAFLPEADALCRIAQGLLSTSSLHAAAVSNDR